MDECSNSGESSQRRERERVRRERVREKTVSKKKNAMPKKVETSPNTMLCFSYVSGLGRVEK